MENQFIIFKIISLKKIVRNKLYCKMVDVNLIKELKEMMNVLNSIN